MQTFRHGASPKNSPKKKKKIHIAVKQTASVKVMPS
jgi:hypothetical protein